MRGFVSAGSRGILGLIGGLFVFKYVLRITPWAWLLAAGFVAVFATSGVVFAPRPAEVGNRRSRTGALVVYGGVGLLALVLALALPEDSRVGRLPAILHWIDSLSAGHFPYADPVVPSGFPALFLLSLPEYAGHRIALLQLMGLGLFAFASVRTSGRDGDRALEQALALLLLPTVYYEVLVRSELFFNVIAVIVLVVVCDESLSPQGRSSRLIVVAALFGIGLSTRSIVALLYVPYVAWRFRGDVHRGLIFSAVVVGVFALTLVPFALWDPPAFVARGPFAVQLAYLPNGISLLILVGSSVAGWRASSLEEVLFVSGLGMFVATGTAFTLTSLATGFMAAAAGDRFDITYFILCTPCFLLSLGRQRRANDT